MNARLSRQGFLKLALLTCFALLLSAVRAVAEMTPQVFKRRGKTLPITPVDRFYVEDYSGPPDSLKRGLGNWRLKVTGRVDHPLSLDLAAIRARPSVKRIITLNCIGNPVGGRAIGNAEWEGISLRELLREADPHFFSKTLVLRAEDGYFDSIPLKQAMHRGALLAYNMNGEPLTLAHGYPLRLLVPGLYGIKQLKWIHMLEVTNDSFDGYWQKKGWSKRAKVKIISRIDVPADRDVLTSRQTLLEGIAFAGDRGIQYVQVSIDGEKTWALAALEPALSPHSWVFWSHRVRFPGPGRYRIAVRAADLYSGIQQDDLRDPFPSGTSGIHRIEVQVA